MRLVPGRSASKSRPSLARANPAVKDPLGREGPWSSVTKASRAGCRQHRRRGHSTRLAASERAAVASCRTVAGPYHRLVGTPRRNPCELVLALKRWRVGAAAAQQRHGCRCTTAAVVAGTRRSGSATAPLARAARAARGRQARGLLAGGTETARALGHCAPRRCASCYRARSPTTKPRCALAPDERSPCHLRACPRAQQRARPPRAETGPSSKHAEPTSTHPPCCGPTRCLPPLPPRRPPRRPPRLPPRLPPRAPRARWQAYVDAFLSNWMALTLPGTHADNPNPSPNLTLPLPLPLPLAGPTRHARR